MALSYAMEIGQRLSEAKAMLSHGEWGRWLREEVNFSQSSANNFMRLYSEYGAKMLENGTNSQPVGNLTYTKALALLAVPEEEREAFAEEVDAANLSKRELEKAIRERQEAIDKAEEAERRAEEFERQTGEAEAKAQTAEDRLSDVRDELDAAREDLERATVQREQLIGEAVADVREQLEARILAANSAKEQAEKQMKMAEEMRKQAQDQAAKLKQDLANLKANPKIPKEMQEKIEKAAADKAKAEDKARIEKAQKDLADALERVGKAEAAMEEAEKRKAEAEKALSVADPDSILFREIFGRIQKEILEAKSILSRIAEKDEAKAGKMTEALRAVLGKAV